MKHPFSVWTNLIYLLGAIPVLFAGHPTGPFFAVVLAALAAESGLYHYHRSWDHQLGDRRGMYLVFVALLPAAWSHQLPTEAPWLGITMLLVAGAAITLSWAAKFKRAFGSKIVLPPLVIASLVGIGLGPVGWGPALWLLLAYLGIAAFRELPQRPPFERYYDPIHAVWHLGTGLLIPITYLAGVGAL